MGTINAVSRQRAHVTKRHSGVSVCLTLRRHRISQSTDRAYRKRRAHTHTLFLLVFLTETRLLTCTPFDIPKNIKKEEGGKGRSKPGQCCVCGLSANIPRHGRLQLKLFDRHSAEFRARSQVKRESRKKKRKKILNDIACWEDAQPHLFFPSPSLFSLFFAWRE